MAEEENRFPKTKFKILGFIVLYTLVIWLIKKATTVELILINPPINIPEDFVIDNTTIVDRNK